MKIFRMLIVIGGLILILGSRLPWMSVPVLFGVEGPTFEAIEIGWEGDGVITGSIGLILVLLGLLWRAGLEKRYAIPGAILASLAALVVIGDFYRILEIGPEAGFFAATGIGLYVTLLGALLALAGILYCTPWYKRGREYQSLQTDSFTSPAIIKKGMLFPVEKQPRKKLRKK
jgi:hypothetical protein